MRQSVVTFFLVLILFFPLRVQATAEGDSFPVDSLKELASRNQGAAKMDLYLQIARVYLEKDPEKSLEYGQKARDGGQRINSKLHRARALEIMGQAQHRLNHYPRARAHLDKAVDIFKELGHTGHLHSSCFHLGKTYYKLGLHRKSDSCYRQALEMARQMDEPEKLGNLYNKMGLNQKKNNAYPQAYRHHQKALEIYQSLNLAEGKANTLNYMGSLHLQRGRYDSARVYYHRSLEIKRRIKDTLGTINTLNNLALVHKNTGQYERAIELPRQAYDLGKTLDRPLIQASILNFIGSVHFKVHQFNQARKHYRQALGLRKNSNDRPSMARSYNNLSLVFRSTEQYDSALVYMKKALEIRKKLANKHLIASSLNNIGSIYWKQGQYDQALRYYLQALEMRNATNDQEGVAASLNNIGMLYQNIYNYEKALNYYQKSLKIKQKLGHKKDIAYTYHIIGNSYYHLDQYRQALNYYHKGLSLREEIGDRLYIAQSHHNIGRTYARLNESGRALEHYQKARELRKKIDDQEGLCSILNDLGNYYRSRQQPDKALNYYRQAIDLAQESGAGYYASLCSRKAGKIQLAQGQTRQGLNLLKGSLEKGEKIPNLELIKNASYQLFRHYQQKDRHPTALDYYMQYARTKDSLSKRKNNMRILETQMNYELSKKQHEIRKIEDQVDELALEKQLKEAKLKRQRNLQHLLVVIIALVLLAAGLLWNRYRLKKKTSALLEDRYNQIKKANEKLSQSEQQLRKANATKDKFFSVIAHDLKNPFNALYGLTDHISKNFAQLSRQELHQYVDLIHESGDQLLQLLENLLHWSRSQRGKIRYNPQPLDLKGIMENTAGLLMINAREKNLSVVQQHHIDSPVYADEEMTTTILRNLLSNAIKFSYSGGQITLRTRQFNGQVQVEVEDQGKGIRQEDQDKLFKVDESFSTHGTSQEKGTGLGLILCAEFVEKQGGKIWVESKENKGSCFKFTLPVADSNK